MTTAHNERDAVLAHVIRVTHSVTGKLVSPLSLELVEPVWPGWSLDCRRDQHVLVIRPGFIDEAPEEVTVRLRPADPALELTLADRGVIGPVTLQGTSWPRIHELRADPAPGVLELHIVDEDGRQLVARSVAVRSRSGDDLSLQERDQDGVYCSPPHAWGPDWHPFVIVIDGVDLATRHFRHDKPLTRLRLVSSKDSH